MRQVDLDMERITKIARDGLAESHDEAHEDIRLDNFVIVATFAFTDDDGDEREGTAVWSEARRHYAKLGMLHQGIDTVREAYE